MHFVCSSLFESIYCCTWSTRWHVSAILKVSHHPIDGRPVMVLLHWWTCLVAVPVAWTAWFSSYHSTSFIVVPVHGGASIWPVFPRICELSGHEDAEFGVLATAAPFPAFTWWPFVVGITAAHGGGSFRTRPRHCKCHTSRGNRMHERRLSSGYGKRQTEGKNTA